ncbi:hypothetical protein [Streptosporangium roseum]|uniref:hypothetical protein n=1 Tax=Streptosporangium roseum TaxID=2001 RepID=UPI0004CD8816|nr:hypothetical protein [Streptosporangium roseum]
MDVTQETLRLKFGPIFPHLDERRRRLLMGPKPAHRGRRVRVRCGEGVVEVRSGGGHNVIDGHFVPFVLM